MLIIIEKGKKIMQREKAGRTCFSESTLTQKNINFIQHPCLLFHPFIQLKYNIQLYFIRYYRQSLKLHIFYYAYLD